MTNFKTVDSVFRAGEDVDVLDILIAGPGSGYRVVCKHGFMWPEGGDISCGDCLAKARSGDTLKRCFVNFRQNPAERGMYIE